MIKLPGWIISFLIYFLVTYNLCSFWNDGKAAPDQGGLFVCILCAFFRDGYVAMRHFSYCSDKSVTVESKAPYWFSCYTFISGEIARSGSSPVRPITQK